MLIEIKKFTIYKIKDIRKGSILIKRLLYLFIIIGIILFPVSSTASSAYLIEALNISVTFPDYFDVITRDMQASQTVLDKYGLDKSNFADSMTEQNFYITAINSKTGNQIIISGYEDRLSKDVWSLSSSDAGKLIRQTGQAQRLVPKGGNITLQRLDPYRFWYYKIQTAEQDLIQYSTIENGTMVHITASAFNGNSLQQEDVDAITELMNGLSFTEITKTEAQQAAEQGEFSFGKTAINIVLFGLIAFLGYRLFVRFRKARKQAQAFYQNQRHESNKKT